MRSRKQGFDPEDEEEEEEEEELRWSPPIDRRSVVVCCRLPSNAIAPISLAVQKTMCTRAPNQISA